MNPIAQHQRELKANGFTIVDNIYSKKEVEELLRVIDFLDTQNNSFRRGTELFAIRQFFKEVPETIPLVFNNQLKTLIHQVIGHDFFVVKGIYFDKPETSNWFVAYHQDLTISVDKRLNLENYGPWTLKQNQFAVQPPLAILENIFTIRIHLDETDENNGALKVIPHSHTKNIYRAETIDWNIETETICQVKQGGILLMKPLILHSSGRTTNGKRRRVIHIELSNNELPEGIKWAERMRYN